MILLEDAIYYHVSGLAQTFRKGEEAPGDGWATERPEGVEIQPYEPLAAVKHDPFDHDFDGRPGGSLPKAKRRAKRDS